MRFEIYDKYLRGSLDLDYKIGLKLIDLNNIYLLS